MRLIDADALMYHLSDYQLQESPGWGASKYENKDAYEAITACIKAIEDAPTIEPEPQWIPCSERLPEHELVLVQFSDGDFSLLQFPTVYRRKDMVAWMPLPEPYKED